MTICHSTRFRFPAAWPLVAALALVLLTAGCRRTQEGKIVADDQAREDAAAKVGTAVDQAGETLEAGAQAAGAALDRASEKLEPRLNDAAVTARVKARLLADPEVNGLEIDVDTVNGVVTLNGRVRTVAQRAEAEKLARGTEGVSEVNNVIQVTGAR